MAQNLFNNTLVVNGDMTSDLISDVKDLSLVDGYAIYANWTGSPVGTIKLQVSVDGTNFVDLSGSETEVNSAGEALWEVTTAYYDKVRTYYTFTSGSGTLNVRINGKAIEVP